MTSDHGEIERASFEYFQPVPGQRAIQLYYRIEHKKIGSTLYQFTLEGDSDQGYKIAWIGEIDQQSNSSVPQMGRDIFAEVTSKGINKDGEL